MTAVMATAPTFSQPLRLSDWDPVEAWRAETLERAGYPRDVAVALAAFPDVDLHVACELLEHGCDLTLAISILV